MEYRFNLEDKGGILGILQIADKDTPIGWDDITIKMSRHQEFHGIFPEVSSTLKFICSGYHFLKNAYDIYGIDADIIIFVDFFYDDTWKNLLVGKIDLSDAIFTHEYIEVAIKPNNCVDLFLNRIDDSFDLFLDTCYDVLTADKTAVHTRYVYSPYRVKFKEMPFVGRTLIEIDNIDDSFAAYYNYHVLGKINYDYYNDPLFPGLGISGTVCSTPPIKTITNNYIIVDDFDIINDSYSPVLPFNTNNQNIIYNNSYQILDTCDDRPIAIAKCECNDLILNISFYISLNIHIHIDEGNFGVSFINPYIDIKWGTYINSISLNTILPVIPNLQAPYDNILYLGYIEQNLSLNINNCQIKEDDELYISFRFDYDTTANASDITQNMPIKGWLQFIAVYQKFRLEIKDLNCLGKFVSVGDTNEYAFALHEAFSTLAEHYTNNCLRVKSCYFGRSNSMEGADDALFQAPAVDCDPNPTTPYNSGLPIPTFNPVPFQTKPNDGCSCAAWTVITSGIILRQMGKWMFISFKQLYDAVDSIYNIGVGYSEADPNILRIEPKEYFYNKEVILSFTIDQKKSNFKRVVDSSNYLNNFKSGYEMEIDIEGVKPYDDIFGNREHVIPLKNVKNNAEELSHIIASGYAIEYQRRTRLSDEQLFDNEHFIVCVGRSADPNQLSNMWEVETGVANPIVSMFNQHAAFTTGLTNPSKYYNFRIRPLYNVFRWLNILKMSVWKKVSPIINFVSGTMNISIGGSEPTFNEDKCDCGWDYKNNKKEELTENTNINIDQITYPRSEMFIYPEIVELEHPITYNDFYLIKAFPYNAISFNNELFYIKEVEFKLNKSTKFKLIKAVV